jgi:hypothetical protein
MTKEKAASTGKRCSHTQRRDADEQKLQNKKGRARLLKRLKEYKMYIT